MIKVSRSWLYGVLAAIVAFSFLATTQSAKAQAPSASVEIVGFVTAITPTTLTVNGMTVNTSRAEIKAVLRVGLKVKVEGTKLADGTVAAREVKRATVRDRIRIQTNDATTSNPNGVSTVTDNRGGHGADDPAGHNQGDDRGGHGADDPAGHNGGDDHGGSSGGGGNSGRGGGDDRGGHN